MNTQFLCFPQWEDPTPIVYDPSPVLPLTNEMLPRLLYDYCMDEAKRADNMTPDFVAVCLIVSLGALIGARIAIKPKQLDEFSIVPNLWGGIVAPPSSKKTPAIKAGTKPLEKLAEKAQAMFKEAQLEKTENDLIYKSTEKNLCKSLDKAKDTHAKRQLARELAQLQQQSEDSPVLKRYFTNDSTPEALAELERNNPNGILVIRDELIGLLSSLDQNDTDTGRAFYLEGWNGTGSYQFDRIQRGSGTILNHCLSILGGIQPDKLLHYLDKTLKGFQNDGLLQRFQLLIYPDPLPWEYVDERCDHITRQSIFALFESIDALDEELLVSLGANPSDQYNPRPYFRFNAEAQLLYKTWATDLNQNIIPKEEYSVLQEHLTKFNSLMPSLALIFDLIERVNGNIDLEGISVPATQMAIKWCEYLESHARRIYGLSLNAGLNRAQYLAQKLLKLKSDDPWLKQGFTLREVTRKQWKYLTDNKDITDALDVLVAYAWLVIEDIEPDKQGGRPTKRYKINPKIF